jgi:tRNA threonylcarbamoyladenosine biosynthesis protein TsaB
MPLILNIDTATEHASVCISNNGVVNAIKKSTEQKNHASFIQPAIQSMMDELGMALSQLDAVAVTKGPGSYTGLRVGLATAKGICYTLNKPLIALNTLEVMAYAAKPLLIDASTLFCPMIDARRMEVFTAVYDFQFHIVVPPVAMILDEYSFTELLEKYHIIFSGSGHHKFKSILNNANAIFSDIVYDASHTIPLAEEYFAAKKFADTAYCEPLYLKEFFSPAAKH